MATAIKLNSLHPLPASEERLVAPPEAKSATGSKANHLKTFWNRNNIESKRVQHLRKEFNGGFGRRFPYKFRKPKRELAERVTKLDDESSTGTRTNEEGKRAYLNPFGKEIWKYEDVDTYLSASTYSPRRLMVQATDSVSQQNTDVTWRRSKARGIVPIALRMADWAVGPENDWFKSAWRLPVVALPLQLLLAFPGANAPWETEDVEDKYLDYVG